MRPAPASRALILGARSVIAQSLAHQFAAKGVALVLAARQSEQLTRVAADLRLRYGVDVDLLEFDALDLDSHASLADRVRQEAGPWELVICVVGCLPDQQLARQDGNIAEQVLATNFTAVAVCLGHLANDLEARREGGVICLTSVAGDRGRQSNYIYGAAKGGLNLFLQGLRNRLAPAGVHVLTVKPGFVDTPMTQGLEGLFLVASPEKVARDVLVAWRKGRDVLYTPWFWRWILAIIRLIPESIFKRLSL